MAEFRVVKKMDAAELRQWRRTHDVASSPGGTTPPPAQSEPVVDRGYIKPLSAKETQTAVFEMFLENMTKDRNAYQAAVRWMRRRQPGLSHRTDEELISFLDQYTRDAVQKNLTDRKLMHPRPLDGIY